jgi:hypothetical protein
MKLSKRLKEFLDRQDAVAAFLSNLTTDQKEMDFILDDPESAFMWDASKEGNEYWERLNDMYYLELHQEQQISFVNSMKF